MVLVPRHGNKNTMQAKPYDPERVFLNLPHEGEEYDPETEGLDPPPKPCNECVLHKIQLRLKDEAIINLQREKEQLQHLMRQAREDAANAYQTMQQGRINYDRLWSDYQRCEAFCAQLREENRALKERPHDNELQRCRDNIRQLEQTIANMRAYHHHKPKPNKR